MLLKEVKELSDGDIKVAISTVHMNLEVSESQPQLLIDAKHGVVHSRYVIGTATSLIHYRYSGYKQTYLHNNPYLYFLLRSDSSQCFKTSLMKNLQLSFLSIVIPQQGFAYLEASLNGGLEQFFSIMFCRNIYIFFAVLIFSFEK